MCAQCYADFNHPLELQSKQAFATPNLCCCCILVLYILITHNMCFDRVPALHETVTGVTLTDTDTIVYLS